MKKRNLILALTIVLVAVAIMAWYTTASKPRENKVTAGVEDIKIHDFTGTDWEGEKSFAPIEDLDPGDSFKCYDKMVYIENIGSKEVLVRVKLNPLFTGVKFPTKADYDLVRYPLLNNGWVLHTDGYYYYPKVLTPTGISPTGMTPFLINKICFDGEKMNNDYKGAGFTLTVEAESIEASNGAPTDKGWLFDPLYQ